MHAEAFRVMTRVQAGKFASALEWLGAFDAALDDTAFSSGDCGDGAMALGALDTCIVRDAVGAPCRAQICQRPATGLLNRCRATVSESELVERLGVGRAKRSRCA